MHSKMKISMLPFSQLTILILICCFSNSNGQFSGHGDIDAPAADDGDFEQPKLTVATIVTVDDFFDAIRRDDVASIERSFNDNLLRNATGFNAMHVAALYNASKTFELLLEIDHGRLARRLLDEANSLGQLPLHLACRQGNYDLVKRIVGSQYPRHAKLAKKWINSPDKIAKMTPLFYVAMAPANTRSHITAEYLSLNGANLTHRSGHDTTIVEEAIMQRNVNLVKYLLERSPQRHFFEQLHLSHLAASSNMYSFIDHLWSHYRPWSVDAYGETPLCYAIAANSLAFVTKVVQKLKSTNDVQSGKLMVNQAACNLIRPSAVNNARGGAFHLAIDLSRQHGAKIFQQLLKFNASVKLRSSDGLTLLDEMAMAYSNVALNDVDDVGFQSRLQQQEGLLPAVPPTNNGAQSRKHVKTRLDVVNMVAAILRRDGAQLEAKTGRYASTAYLKAITSDALLVADVLASSQFGANRLAVDSRGRSAWQLAKSREAFSYVQWTTITSFNQQTVVDALRLAVSENKSMDFVAYLLDQDISASQRQQLQLAHLAVRSNNIDFLNRYANSLDLSSAKDDRGRTALTLALELGHMAAAQSLINSGQRLFNEKCSRQCVDNVATTVNVANGRVTEIVNASCASSSYGLIECSDGYQLVGNAKISCQEAFDDKKQNRWLLSGFCVQTTLMNADDDNGSGMDVQLLGSGALNKVIEIELLSTSYMSVYLFDVVNADAFYRGEKPVVKEVGPFVYKVVRRRNVEGVDDGQLSFTEIKTFEFDRQRTPSHLSEDEPTVLNLDIVAYGVTKQAFDLDKMSVLAKTLAVTKRTVPLKRWRPRDLLFGHRDNLLEKILPLKYAQAATRPAPIFGIFHDRTSKSVTGQQTANYSIDSRTGSLLAYQNQRLAADLGQVFGLSTTAAQQSRIYLPEWCFSMQFGDAKDRFDVERWADDVARWNRLQCTPETSGDSVACLQRGVINATTCRSGQSFVSVSLPHLLGADELYRGLVDGLQPRVDEHSPRRRSMRYQINWRVEAFNFKQYAKLPKLSLLPVLWIKDDDIVE